MKLDMWQLYTFFIVSVFFLSIGMTFGNLLGNLEIEKRCMYEHRIEFSGQLYSCQWLEGVTIDNQPYERKPHPLKEILK